MKLYDFAWLVSLTTLAFAPVASADRLDEAQCRDWIDQQIAENDRNRLSSSIQEASLALMRLNAAEVNQWKTAIDMPVERRRMREHQETLGALEDRKNALELRVRILEIEEVLEELRNLDQAEIPSNELAAFAAELTASALEVNAEVLADAIDAEVATSTDEAPTEPSEAEAPSGATSSTSAPATTVSTEEDAVDPAEAAAEAAAVEAYVAALEYQLRESQRLWRRVARAMRLSRRLDLDATLEALTENRTQIQAARFEFTLDMRLITGVTPLTSSSTLAGQALQSPASGASFTRLIDSEGRLRVCRYQWIRSEGMNEEISGIRLCSALDLSNDEQATIHYLNWVRSPNHQPQRIAQTQAIVAPESFSFLREETPIECRRHIQSEDLSGPILGPRS
jgi:hypothetical protein